VQLLVVVGVVRSQKSANTEVAMAGSAVSVTTQYLAIGVHKTDVNPAIALAD
jgi:hypothetical protein